MTLLLVAIQFLTRLPVPAVRDFEPAMVSRSARWFPLVGQMVGGVCAAVFAGASAIWSGPVAALLALSAGVLVSGGFHEDGLADTADGLGGGQTPARRLEIMKDSRIGTYGVLALGLVLALKAAALASLPPWRGAVVLVAAHGLARAAAVVAMGRLPYVGDSAKWTPASLTAGEVAMALALSAWPLVLLPPALAGLGLGVAAALALAPALAARRLIGGQTGDVLGAVEQMFELGFLLAAAALPFSHAGG